MYYFPFATAGNTFFGFFPFDARLDITKSGFSFMTGALKWEILANLILLFSPEKVSWKEQVAI